MQTYDPKACDKNCAGFRKDCSQYQPYSKDKEMCDIAYIRMQNLYRSYSRPSKFQITEKEDLKGLDKILLENKKD